MSDPTTREALAIAQDVLRGYGHDAIADAIEGFRPAHEVAERETEYGVDLSDARVREFRSRRAAQEHIDWLRRQKRFASMVAREVTYGSWVPVIPEEPKP